MKRLILIFVLCVGIGAYFYTRPHDIVTTQESLAVQENVQKPICEYRESELLRLINIERTKVGSSAVTIDSLLDSNAEERAASMDVMDNHEGFYELLDSGVFRNKFSFVGENLAGIHGSCTTEIAFVKSWMVSALGHRETMLDSRYEHIGIGYNQGIVVTIYGDLH